MDYFYCPPEKILSDELIIDGEEFSHLVHVMRKKEGDDIRVVDGRGTAYDVRLGGLKKKMVSCTILRVHHNHHEPSVAVTLAVGVLKNPSKFDFLVEKVAELGVKEIIPLKTERTISNHAKTDRWQKLALAAMKQCGRSYLPIVKELITLDDFLEHPASFEVKLFAHEKTTDATSINPQHIKAAISVAVLIGPEGGFTDEEAEHCFKAGYRPLYFGERKLRTETAAILAAALTVL